MPRDARFWRNVTIIAVAHIAIVVALVRWNRAVQKPPLQSVVWMNSSGPELSKQDTPAQTETTPPPESEPPRPAPDDTNEPSAPPLAKSDLQLPVATPSPTPVLTPPPRPTATPLPKASPRPTAKPTPKATPKKSVAAKATPKPSPKKQATPAEPEKRKDQKEPARIGPTVATGVGDEKSSSIEPGNAVRGSEFNWYGKMLHDRFYSEWKQPTTSVPIGAKMSALVRIRIEKDGRVSNFTIVRLSGNVVVDESVAAVAKRVTRVDPLPKGLGGASYEVNINFELRPDE